MSFLGKGGSEMKFEGSRREPKAVPGVCSTWVSQHYAVLTVGANWDFSSSPQPGARATQQEFLTWKYPLAARPMTRAGEMFVIFCLVAPAVEQEELGGWLLYPCHQELPPHPSGWGTHRLGSIPGEVHLPFCFSVISLKREKGCGIFHLEGN